ncbi:MAG: ATP-binding protein [Bacteroidetes bacterium]|nr:ATP-binding protein [Bacteroidota bacterium]
MSRYIQKLILQGEHQQLDFKFEISDAKKIARSLVAFANTDGGRLLVGVKDNGAIAGVRTDEEFYMVEMAAQLYCKPPVHFTVAQHKVQGRTVLEIYVPKSEEAPHSARDKEDKWMIYIRVKDKNFLANSILLKVWKRKKQSQGTTLHYTEPEKNLLKYLSEFQQITFREFIQRAAIKRNVAETILVNFISLGIVEIDFQENETYYRLAPNWQKS